MANLSATEAVKSALVAYLKASMPSIKDVFDDFPNGSQNLKYPCATVVTGRPTYQSIDPYVISKGAVDSASRRAPVRRVVGNYEIPMQVDIWSAHKIQRHKLYEELFAAVNRQVVPMGLSLKMVNYFDQHAHFHITGFDFPDSEEQSQRQEWRAIVSLTCTVNHVLETSEFLMETIETTVEADFEMQIPETEEEAPESII